MLLDEGSSSLLTAPTMHHEIVARLRAWVVETQLPAGAKIPERELCEAFDISRTPMREALKVLAAEGLIELLPNRGARIKVLTPEEVGDLMDLMAGLEALAGRLACERITPEEFETIETLHRDMYAHFLRGDRSGYFQCNQSIHEALFAAARNPTLIAHARSLHVRLRRVRYSANQDAQGERWREAVREHELILGALRRRDGHDLATILFSHLRSTRDAVLSQIKP